MTNSNRRTGIVGGIILIILFIVAIYWGQVLQGKRVLSAMLGLPEYVGYVVLVILLVIVIGIMYAARKSLTPR